MVKALAVIPARGGSKGLPRKNVRLLCGKPLIAWAIMAAQGAHTVSRVIVSTDDAEIAQVSREYGAEVIMRPSEISGDNTSSESALMHVLETLKSNEGIQPEILVFLQCTSPLTASTDIDETVQTMIENNADSSFAVAPFHSFLWMRTADDYAAAVNHDATSRKMRQDCEPQYIETGSVYVMKTGGFLQSGHRFFEKTCMHVIPKERCLEIDDMADFSLAESRMTNRLHQQAIHAFPRTVGALVLDFDGVFTDNRVYVMQDGLEAVACHRGDGMGISLLRQKGIPVLVISSEVNPVVEVRCEKIGVPCLSSVSDKLASLRQWLEVQGISLENTIYVGNDMNDLACIRAVGCGVAVADAHSSVRAAADIVLSRVGGDGAVREIIDMIVERSEAL